MADNSEYIALTNRAKTFMLAFDPQVIKRRRQTERTQQRQARYAEAVYKRCNLQPERSEINLENLYKTDYQTEDFPELMQAISSASDSQLLFAAYGLRVLLERRKNFQQPLDKSVLDHLLLWIQRSDFPKLQAEAAWCMCNLAARMSCEDIVNKGGMALLQSLLDSPSMEVRENALWCLSNIAADSLQYRNCMLENRVIPQIIQFANEAQTLAHKELAGWALMVLSKRSDPNCSDKRDARLVLEKLILENNSPTLLKESLRAWRRIFRVLRPAEGQTLCSQFVSHVVQLLGDCNDDVQQQAIKIIANIATKGDQEIQVAIDCGSIQAVELLLNSPNHSIQRAAASILSNMCQSNLLRQQAVIDSGAFAKLIPLLHSNLPTEVAEKVAWAVCNACTTGTKTQVLDLARLGAAKALCGFLNHNNPSLVNEVINALIVMLESSSQKGVKQKIKNARGLQYFKQLEKNSDGVIAGKAKDLIKKFFNKP